MRFKAFIDQCYKRKIFKGFSIYALVSWVIIQVAATTFPYLGIPTKTVTVIIIMVLIGLPISLIFSWYYNVIPDDQEEAKEIEAKLEEKKASNLFRIIIAFITILILAIAFVLARNIPEKEKQDLPEKVNEVVKGRIAVLDFENYTTGSEFAQLGKAAANWVSHSIVESKLGKVISPEMISNYSALMSSDDSESQILNKYLLPESIIEGSITSEDENLIYKCTISNVINKETNIAFPDIKISKSNPTLGMKKLSNMVLSHLATADQPNLQLQDEPPNFTAYSYLLEAKALDIGSPECLLLLNRALSIDSNYFEAKVLRLSHFYNNDAYETADSLRLAIKPNASTSSRQRNLYNFYSALLSGKNKQIYATWKNEYDHAPFYLTDNSTLMVLAQQFINRPQEVDAIYQEIDFSDINIENCSPCESRIFIKAFADIELKKYQECIDLTRPYVKVGATSFLLQPLVIAYIRNGNNEELNELMEEMPTIALEDGWQTLYSIAGREYELLNDTIRSRRNYTKALNYYERIEDKPKLAETYFDLKKYQKAKTILEQLSRDSELKNSELSMLAVCYLDNNQINKASEIENKLKQKDSKYDFGNIDYNLAIIQAFKKNKDLCLQYLLSSVKKGARYRYDMFQNDPQFSEYHNEAAFQELLSYWH